MFRMNGMPRAQGCAIAAKHIPVALFLDILSLKVLVVYTSTPASVRPRYLFLKPLAHHFALRRGCAVPYFRTLRDMDVENERTRMSCSVS